MKKFILAPLCSAFVVPGLGQVINQELKKGALLLGAVFLLLVLSIVYLSLIAESILSQPRSAPLALSHLLERTEILLILGAYGGIWLYSVADAFVKGWSWEHRTKP